MALTVIAQRVFKSHHVNTIKDYKNDTLLCWILGLDEYVHFLVQTIQLTDFFNKERINKESIHWKFSPDSKLFDMLRLRDFFPMFYQLAMQSTIIRKASFKIIFLIDN